MLGVCIRAIILNQTQLENFRVMRINDGTVGLLEVANEILKQPHLHLEPLVLVVVLRTILKKAGATFAIFFDQAKCSIGEVLPGLVV
jgi:hypothetical protein